MSTSKAKIDYPKLGRTQKGNDFPTDSKGGPATVTHQQAPSLLVPATNSKPNSPVKKNDPDYLDVFNKNFNSSNINYIDGLLKQKQAATNRDKSPEVVNKKGSRPVKRFHVDINKDHPKAQPNSPETGRKRLEIKQPQYNIYENDKPQSMRPEVDDGVITGEVDPAKRDEKTAQGEDVETFYEGNDTHRNLNHVPKKNEGKLFETYFQGEGLVRRSMSLEDIRMGKKTLEGNRNKSTLYNHGGLDLESYSIEKSPDVSMYHEIKQGVVPVKDDFLANMDRYIEYFNKSENNSYRSMKAGQYFYVNSGKSHRSIQRELEAANNEINILRVQMEKMKRKMNELIGENKNLAKELKISNAREEEQEQKLHKIKEQVFYVTEKNRRYKLKYRQLLEAFEQERKENENNLISLKQVLANSINLALDQKASAHGTASKDRQQRQIKNIMIDNFLANKHNLYKMKEKMRLNGTADAFNYDPGAHLRSRDPRETPKREGSAFFSQKVSLSSGDEDEGEEEFSNQLSNSMEFENSYGVDDFQDSYPDNYMQGLTKGHHNKMMQGKLAEFINSKDISSNGYGKTKSSRGKLPHHGKNASMSGLQNYYLAKQANLAKQPHSMMKHNLPEQLSRGMPHEYEETPSLNEVIEGSFSLQNSD